MSSDSTFAKSLGPDRSKLFETVGFQERIFRKKVDFEKNKSADDKKVCKITQYAELNNANMNKTFAYFS